MLKIRYCHGEYLRYLLLTEWTRPVNVNTRATIGGVRKPSARPRHTMKLFRSSASAPQTPLAAGASEEAARAAAPGSHQSSEVFVVRHGERVHETSERTAFFATCGDRWYDPPLTAKGVAQARQAGEYLEALHASQPFEEVLCSPLLRTVQTAS